MKIKKKYIIIYNSLAFIWLVSIILSVSFGLYIVGILGFPFIIASLVVAFVFCKCPYCGSKATIRLLTLNGNTTNYCPRCGNKIEIE